LDARRYGPRGLPYKKRVTRLVTEVQYVPGPVPAVNGYGIVRPVNYRQVGQKPIN